MKQAASILRLIANLITQIADWMDKPEASE